MEKLHADIMRRIENIEKVIYECELPVKEDSESEHYEVDTEEKICKLQTISCDCKWLIEQSEHIPTSITEKTILDMVLLYSQFTNPDKSWNDISVSQVALDGIEDCVHLSKCRNLQELLTGKTEAGSSKLSAIVPKLLIRLSQKFDKNNWKKYPGLLVTYFWILKNLKVNTHQHFS